MNAAASASASASCLHWLGEYSRCRDALPGADLPWLADLREAAMRRFLAKGFPTLHDEDWKYTSVGALEKGGFSLATAGALAVDPAQVEALALPGAHLLVFVDGHHVPRLSRLGELLPGAVVDSLAAVLAEHPERIEAELIRLAQPERDVSAFAALNAACMSDGACLVLPAGARVEEPIHLLFLAATPDLAVHSRNLVLAGADSSARIVEHHAALGEPRQFTNAVTHIALGTGARIEHHKLQQESRTAFHIAAIDAELAADSRLLSTSFALGGALARADIRVTLAGEGAECLLDGLYMADGRQHLDHHTRIDHRLPRGTSRELYKGVLDGAARAVFNGKVFVHPDAQKSDAAQINRNLLLSAQAEVDTKPQLEIWADDVKCSHGATVGQLDADQIFYLRARGLDDAAARALLTYAFAAEMVQRVGLAPLSERLDALVRARLPHAPEALS